MEPISTSLADPDGSHALVAAAQWLQQTLLGTVATTIAVIAVASVGLMMLTGRMHYRHGATVIVGCFVLFGASSIVAGLQGTLSGTGRDAPIALEVPPQPAFAPPPPISGAPSGGYDPYAGASVPPS